MVPAVSSLIKNRRVVLLLLLILAVIAALFMLVYFKGAKSPLGKAPHKGPKVSTKTEYNNPFDKKSQYVNPFESYKNPFVVSK